MASTDKKAAVARYTALYGELNSLILEWDPLGLFSAGEMSDEFSEEVARVLGLLAGCRSPEEVAGAIRSVFVDSFSDPDFSPGSCDAIGTTVHAWWAFQP